MTHRCVQTGDCCGCPPEPPPRPNLSEYKRRALALAIYPQRGDNLTYTALGLLGETGEFCDKLKKEIRDGVEDDKGLLLELGDVLWYVMACADECGQELAPPPEDLPGLKIEACGLLLGKLAGRVAEDVLCGIAGGYIAAQLRSMLSVITAAARVLGSSLQEVARMNLEKLESRAARGVLHGEGDER